MMPRHEVKPPQKILEKKKYIFFFHYIFYFLTIFYFDKKRSFIGNSRFMCVKNSLRIQHINYFNHVLELFKPYLSTNFKLKTKSFVDNRTNNSYSSVNFATLSLPCFNYYRNIFYNSDNLKIVPSNIQNLLTPRGLAVKKKNIFFLRLDYG